uniref:Uncharacterized protein n=1 Tax=Ciona savignyi TaxID=51511 RepID=H2Z351_CIOSA
MLALGMVIGPVAAGGIYDATKSYATSFYMGGGLFTLCALVMFAIPLSLRYFKPAEVEPDAPVEHKVRPAPSIVKPNALRKLAQHQAALQSSKSKFHGDVEKDLKELDEIENEVNGNGHVTDINESGTR